MHNPLSHSCFMLSPLPLTQALPLNALVYVNMFSCCAGEKDCWGSALHALCHVVSTVMQRPVAVVNCYRLGDQQNPRLAPAHVCRGRCQNMADSSTEAIGSYRLRLATVLKQLAGLETVVLAFGLLAQLACLKVGPVLPHAPVGYPVPRIGHTVQSVWRSNVFMYVLLTFVCSRRCAKGAGSRQSSNFKLTAVPRPAWCICASNVQVPRGSPAGGLPRRPCF